MQQQIWTKFIARMKWYTVPLLFIAAVVSAGCQQPAKPLVTETQQKKAIELSTGSKKEKKQGKDKSKKDGENKQTENQQPNNSGVGAYQGFTIPDTLSRSPQELRKMIIQETQRSESEMKLNAQGQVVKYVEKEIEYDITAAFKDNILLDPAHNSIYPGAVLVGSSIDKGSYREISQGRKREATISFSLQGVKDKEKGGQAGITSGKIIPTLAAYRKLHNEVLSQHITYHASASLSYEETEIKNEQSFDTQFKVGVGFAAAGIKSKIAAGFKFKDGDNLHRHLIKFVETFYTVDVDQENVPLMLDIPREVAGERIPVYVSSVSYGRIAYLTVESKKTWQELKPSFETVLKRGTTNIGDVDLNAAIKELQDNAVITINIIGGGSQAVTNVAQFQRYIVNGGFSSGNPGQIIKYQLRFLDDNAPAHIKYGGSYKTVERKEIPAEGYEISATVTNVKLTCKDFHSANVVGTVGIQPQGRKDLCKMIFQHDGTSGHPKLAVINQEAKTPQKLTQSIVIPQNVSTAELVFEIRTEVGSEAPRRFTTKNPVDDKLKSISGLTRNKLEPITLYREGFPEETLTFDIKFDVKKVP
ncbi:thiol-activated cytolysin family protein [Treponema sp.]|uniref:thiol-activated cytolysin family protein n=1 Tax=Treponema sp. TaxID=166 RepID=UPI003FA1A82C